MQIWNGPLSLENVAIDSLGVDAERLAAFSLENGPYIGEYKLDPKLIASEFSKDPFPIPQTDVREYYFGEDHLGYWLSGFIDLGKIDERCPRWRDSKRVLDFGCSSGRILRHFKRALPHAEIWGNDLKRSSIDWMRRFMPDPQLRFLHSTLLPNLPFESGSFDFISAFSVFTHIDQGEESWLLELRRLLRPGGKLYLTVMTDRIWNEIESLNALYENYASSKQFGLLDFSKPMPSERVVWSSGSPIYGETILYSKEYLERNWFPFFSESQLIPLGHNFQDVLVLEK